MRSGTNEGEGGGCSLVSPAGSTIYEEAMSTPVISNRAPPGLSSVIRTSQSCASEIVGDDTHELL